ncbi:FecCD family ABC transporter permease [Arhodomonas sp. AD133]|uniref:FecCD family ABC transporter permease n=1 Tax=Arhodomonas sp. AD133 TaxID=3415009 RepID=UPI003EBAE0F0
MSTTWYRPRFAGAPVWRLGTLSLRLPLRPRLVLLGLAGLLAVGVILALTAGPGQVGLIGALQALAGQGPDVQQLLVRDIRLPRIWAGLLAGAGLGAAGCLLQTVARNHLATTAILGINEGATFAMMLMIIAADSGTLGGWWVALLGAGVTAAALLVLAGQMGSRGYRVLIVGLGLSAALRALTELGLAWANLQHASAVYAWSIGSLVGRGEAVTPVLAGAMLALVLLALVLGRGLTLLQLSLPNAATLGLDVGRCQLQAFALAVALSGLAVGIGGPVGGPVGLLALASPIIARKLEGPGRVPTLSAALVGAMLVLLADTLGRVVAAPVEIPAGAVASIFGGPFLLWILLTEGRGGE